MVQNRRQVNAKERIILALDTPSPEEALHLLDSLNGLALNVKIGPGLFIQNGPDLINTLHGKGYRVFLDLKLYDIPNTVGLAIAAAKKMGVWMVSVHLCGGKKMLQTAVREAQNNPLVVGITVLTSFSENELKATGVQNSLEAHVQELALLGLKQGVNGIVASPWEVRMLRSILPKNMLIITPGIRPQGAPAHDQVRTMTPREALEAGADYLVIGRAVLEAPKPREALSLILAEVENVKDDSRNLA